ncbi:putative carbohydrate esterase [Phytophthora cinnamomi]|uniref:putative carbohydrate esterase n=1 Tax=Phytophthora cinnamomi TaxID=4785 RepID=UPI00355A303B|nr:putative carbohydrate esterase [Phytophthora cinnamomi]
MSGALVDFGLHVIFAGALLVYFNVLQFGFPVLVVSTIAAYAALFAGFCYAARLLTTSLVLVPFIALKLQLKLVSLFAVYGARGFKPTFPESTLAYELTTSMMRYMFVEFGETIVNDYTHLMREPFAMHGRLILQSNCRKHNTAPEMLLANGMEHTWLRDPETKEHRIVVIHYHGGGYCISDPLQDVELANQTHSILKQILKEQYQLEVSVDVLLVNYRKAPEYLYPTALNDCFDMYKYVLKHESVAPAHVVFSGDSAGAEMSMTNCMRLRKESPELQPAAALCIATYLRSVTDPEKRRLASAINQSLRDLPPIFLQWGKLERFYEQGLRFKVKADAEGVTNMELDILKNMVHDPVMLPTAVSPAAEKGIRNGCAFAAKHLANALRLRSVDPEPEPHNINNMW